MIQAIIDKVQGNKGHSGAYAALVITAFSGIGTSVDLLLELGKLRAMETYYEMAITKLTDEVYECEND